MVEDINLVEEYPPARLKKMMNLKMFRGMSEEEILESIRERRSRGVKSPTKKVPITPIEPEEYEKRFKLKFNTLRKEFGGDFNDSNDEETARALIRLQIQLENVAKDIDTHQKAEPRPRDHYETLKKLNEVQRNIIVSVKDLQEKLGITREQRKEKKTDDIPIWIDGILAKAKDFYDMQTTIIRCPKDKIELARFWINFPKESNDIAMSLTCWKCKEVTEFVGG